MSEGTAERIVIQCEACSARYKVPAATIGKRTRCKKCGTAFTIDPPDQPKPGLEQSAAPEQTPDEPPISFECEVCGATLKARAAAIGKRVRCKSCGGIQTVPEPPEPGGVGDDDVWGALAEGQAVQLAPADDSTTGRPCPSCGGSMPGGGTLCTACGYNIQTGIAAAPSVTRDPTTAQRSSEGFLNKLGVRVILGCGLSIIAAGLGTILWIVVLALTGYESGFVAWGIGGLAGLGMALGFRGVHPLAGIGAALFATGGILIAKMIMVLVILAPSLMYAVDETLPPRQALTEHLANRAFWDDPEDRPPEAHQAEAMARVAEMTDEEVLEELDVARDYASSQTGGATIGDVFGLIDLLFFGLAIITAYRLGARGFSSAPS